MYKIIGADGKEYGPVTAEQLRDWIAQGRANAQTKALAEGITDWKALGELPEFAAVLGAAGAGAPLVAGQVDPEALAAAIIARGYRIDIGSCIGRSWELLKANFWPMVGATLLALLIASGGGIPFVGPVVGMIVGGPMMGGLYLFFLRRIRGQPATVGDIFQGFSLAFAQLLLLYIVSTLLTGLGLLLCLLPGIYLAVSWIFALLLVIDKRLDFWPAMELSRKVVSHHWWTIFGLSIVAGLVSMLGVFACIVGIFVTMPIMFGAIAYAYEDIFGERPARTA
jgi:uncharacterized membrane protein